MLTKCICHKGFCWYSSVVARSNFCVVGQVTTPQSLTVHALNGWERIGIIFNSSLVVNICSKFRHQKATPKMIIY